MATGHVLGGLFGGLGEGLVAFAALRAAEQRERRDRDERRTDRDLSAKQRDRERVEDRKERELLRSMEATQRAEDVGFRNRQFNATMDDRRIDRKRQRQRDIAEPLERLRYTIDPAVLETLSAANEMRGKEFTQGVAPDVVAANSAMRQAETPDLAALTQQARGRSRVGMQGDVVRAPVPGSAGGVTYHPETVTLSQPTTGVGGVGRGGRRPDPTLTAAMRTFYTALNAMEEARRDDPNADILPNQAMAGRSIAGFNLLGWKPGEQIGTALAQSSLNSAQTRYWDAARVLAHTYPSLLRHSRVGPVMIEMMQEALATVPGQTDVDARARKHQMIRSIGDDFRREIESEYGPIELTDPTSPVGQHTPTSGAPFDDGSGGSVPPATGPRINPRFLPRRP